MKFANATNLDRKSGVAQWRDLRFLFRFHAHSKAPRILNHLPPHPAYSGPTSPHPGLARMRGWAYNSKCGCLTPFDRMERK
jgi:hypothetical protein